MLNSTTPSKQSKIYNYKINQMLESSNSTNPTQPSATKYISVEQACVVSCASFYTVRKLLKELTENPLITSLEQSKYNLKETPLFEIIEQKSKSPMTLISLDYVKVKYGETEIGKFLRPFYDGSPSGSSTSEKDSSNPTNKDILKEVLEIKKILAKKS